MKKAELGILLLACFCTVYAYDEKTTFYETLDVTFAFITKAYPPCLSGKKYLDNALKAKDCKVACTYWNLDYDEKGKRCMQMCKSKFLKFEFRFIFH